MNVVPQILRGMTDGYFINIGRAEDTLILETSLKWEGFYIDETPNSLYRVVQDNLCPTMIYYLTIRPPVSVEFLKAYFDEEQKSTKRKVIMCRVFHSDELKAFLTSNFYTYVSSEGDYDYFIHILWGNLL
jgi:hypothetical protein